MKKILIAVALLAIPFPTLAAQPKENPDVVVVNLVAHWTAYDIAYRGNGGRQEDGDEAARTMDQLQKLGWCYFISGKPTSEYRWHHC